MTTPWFRGREAWALIARRYLSWLRCHVFQVIAIDGRPMRGAVRDTVLVAPMGRVRVAFDADNPGRWAFHCHNLYHMAAGMMTEFRYQGIAA